MNASLPASGLRSRVEYRTNKRGDAGAYDGKPNGPMAARSHQQLQGEAAADVASRRRRVRDRAIDPRRAATVLQLPR